MQTVPVTSSHGRGSIQIISDIGLSEAKIEDFVTPGFGTLRFNGLRRVPSTGERNRKDGLGRDIEGLEDFSKAIPRTEQQPSTAEPSPIRKLHFRMAPTSQLKNLMIQGLWSLRNSDWLPDMGPCQCSIYISSSDDKLKSHCTKFERYVLLSTILSITHTHTQILKCESGPQVYTQKCYIYQTSFALLGA